MNPMIPSPRQKRERGISLVTTLVMLLAVMVLGLSAITISKSQFMLAGNLQFQSGATVAAEQWLISGTNSLDAGFTTFNPNAGSLYPIGYMTANSIDPLTMTWSTTNSIQVGNITTQRYLIEFIAKDKTLIPTGLAVGGRSSSGCNKTNVYRIIAQGGSARGSSRMVQSIYSVLSC